VTPSESHTLILGLIASILFLLLFAMCVIRLAWGRRGTSALEDYPIEPEMYDDGFLELGLESDDGRDFFYENPDSLSGDSFGTIFNETTAPLDEPFRGASEEAKV
jgi:hypothetical protein